MTDTAVARVFTVDPHDDLAYTWRFADWLADSETIADATFDIDGSDTANVHHISIGDTDVTAWVTGGLHGEDAVITCHIDGDGTPASHKDLSALFRFREQ